MVIDYMSKNKSLFSFAGTIRVTYETIKNWRKAYPEFNDACEIGRSVRAGTLEDTLNLKGKALTPAVAKVAWDTIKNVAPEEYRDKVVIEDDRGSGGATKALSDLRDDLRAIAQGVMPQLGSNKSLTEDSVIEADYEEIHPTTDNPPADDLGAHAPNEATKKPPE